ncbi:MAG TPA: hypothetical protein VMR06_02620 [Dokdonella sp.]|uniref:hypothetical protein n=1 Tax=Dokdonella sp. TaxID=2291710 RepID=UPI002CCEEB81|nr:hypothetical protein [Dokdonella sp.]HUD40871.1 hypothetical protein [Dokdonella sp.]
MNRSTLLPALSTLALALAAASSAQPLPYGSYNQAGRVLDFGESAQVAQDAGRGSCSGDLCLTVTLALADAGNPALCGTATSLDVTVGDEVNICYTLTNHSSATLNYHTLVDGDVGTLLTNYQHAVAPHASFQYNRVIVASTSETATTGDFRSTWTAAEQVPTYAPNTTNPEPFVDISATGTALDIGDGESLAATAPFPLEFYGDTYTDLCVGNNGGLMLGVGSCLIPYVNYELPTAQLTGPSLLPHWDAFWPSGMVYYGSVGAAPNRRFVVSWHDKTNRAGLPTGQHGATFQVIFNESSPTLTYVYRTATFGGSGAANDNGSSATVGMQRDPVTASQFSFDTPSLSDGLAITWTFVAGATFQAVADATVAVGAPVIGVSPAAGLTPTILSGTSGTDTLQIANTGNRTLLWSWSPPAARSHFPAQPRHAVEAFVRSPAGQAQTAPDRRGRRAALPDGVDSVPARGLLSGSVIDYVSFDVLQPYTYDLIRSNQVWAWAADFAYGHFDTQFGVTGFDGSPRLFAIDTASGEARLIAPVDIPPTRFAYGGAWDPVTGTFFVAANNYGDISTTLYTVDLTNGNTVEIGTIAGRLLGDIAVDVNGLMYGMDVQNDMLVAVDKTTAEAQVIGPTGLNLWYTQGLDFDDRTGTLYLTAAGDNGYFVYAIDPQTGQPALVSPSFGEIGGFSIAAEAPICTAPEEAPWLSYAEPDGTVDPAMAVTTGIGIDATSLAPGVYSATLCLYSNDPEPSRSRVTLPLTLTVSADDVVFRDGFDGAP